MSATAIASSDDEPPFITIAVTGLTDYIGGVLTCVRLNPDGTTDPVRQADPNVEIDAAEMALVDYEAPYGIAVSYRTLAVLSPETDLEQSTGTATVDTSQPWLVHPGTPALSQPIEVTDLATRTREINQSIQAPIGRRRPIVLTDGTLRSPAGTLEITTETLTERDDLLTLLQDLTPLLLNIPHSLGWGVTSEWVAFGGVTETAIIGGSPVRTFVLPYRTVERPVGTVTIDRSWADVLTEAASWTELKNRYVTWLGVFTGQEGV